MPEFIPHRLCCGQAHWGVICPDGKVMCCICFSRFSQDELHVDENGDREDVCKPCGEIEDRWKEEHENTGHRVAKLDKQGESGGSPD